MIKYIIFDLAEVCMQGLKGGIEKEISRLTGASEAEISKNLQGDKLIKVFEGRATEDEYWQAVMEEGKYQLPLQVIREIARNNFREFPETVEIIKKLKSNGYPIGLLSDHVREWIEDIESRFDFMQLFDKRFYSFDSKCTKLETRAFTNALFGMNANPSRTLFIDDTANNLIVAKRAGIEYVHRFTDADSLTNALEEFGVKLKDNENF